MKNPIFIKDVNIVNEGRTFLGSVLIIDNRISNVFEGKLAESSISDEVQVIEGKGKYLIPGVIDDQVHFREPGLTYKGDIEEGAKAAVAGGVTSFMDMPNVKPPSTTVELLEERYAIAAKKSVANYSFYIGATNDNLEELKKVNPKEVCGVKIFMGSSTGNMLVDNKVALEEIFTEVKMLIATHCEDEESIKRNVAAFKEKYGEDADVKYHPEIRDEEVCYLSSSFAVGLAKKCNTRLHILHLSTAKEMSLFEKVDDIKKKRITGEVCVHHIWFDDQDYAEKGSLIKWNPAIKKASDKEAIRQALNDGIVDVIATDHAPHTLEEKQGGAFTAMSGGPMVQHSLNVMLELHEQGVFTMEKVVDLMCHKPAQLFDVEERGFIREGYFADLVLVSKKSWEVSKKNLMYKCGWSPLEGQKFSYKVDTTIVNGNVVYQQNRVERDAPSGMRLTFDR
jgi:dihydroorotase